MEKAVKQGGTSITELLPKNGLVYSEKAHLSEVNVETDTRTFFRTYLCVSEFANPIIQVALS